MGPLIIKKTSYNMKIFLLKLSHPYFKSHYLREYNNFSVLKASIISNVFLVIVITILGLINPGIFFIPIFIILKGVFIGYTVAFF